MTSSPIRGYRDLIAWQKAMDLVDGVFDLAARLRTPESFGLSDQLRRAAISIPANLAEGHGRRTRGEYIRYVSIANGSLRELETHLMILGRRRLATTEDIEGLLARADEVGRVLTGLHRKLVGMPRPT
jgi:four helix bundle protein